ncbi:hypothetical protein PLESTF_001210400 [Pleodorina starrii]|nr:hypothetical protein PLESTF_001210400 [Pleodorina starrii]
MVTPSKYEVASEALLAHVERKDLDMRRENIRMLRTSRGSGIESLHRSRQACDALQLADVSELTAGLLKVPSVSSDDVEFDDVRAKAKVLDANVRRSGVPGRPVQKSAVGTSNTPAKAGGYSREHGHSAGAKSPISASFEARHQQSPQRHPRARADSSGLHRGPSPSAGRRSGGSAAAASGGGYAPRASHAGVSSPAVQALGGLRRAWAASTPGDQDMGADSGGGVAAALALARASRVRRDNSRQSREDAGTEGDDRDRADGEHFRDAGWSDGGRRPSGVLGVRQRVAAAASAAGRDSPAADRQHQKQQLPQRSQQLERQRSPRRASAVSAGVGGVRSGGAERHAPWDAAPRRRFSRDASPVSSCSSSSDDFIEQPRGRSGAGAPAATPGTRARAGNSSIGGNGGAAATPGTRARAGNGSSGGSGLVAGRSSSGHRLTADAAAFVPIAGGGRSTTGGGGAQYDSTSSSSSSYYDDGNDDKATAWARQRRASACDKSSGGGGGRFSSGAASVISSVAPAAPAAPAISDSVGMRKLRGQLERARQSLQRLQLSSGGGAPPPPPVAAARRSSGGPGLGGRAGAAPRRADDDDAENDVRAGALPDDDIAQLLDALLAGQPTSAREIAAAAAASAGGAAPRSPYNARAGSGGSRRLRDEDEDDDDDEPWRIAVRPLPPGKRVRLMRALQQLHARQPQLLQSRRHGRRLARLMRGVATSDAEAELLIEAVTDGGGRDAARRGASGAVAVLAAMLGGRTSCDGTSSGAGGGGGWGRAAAPLARAAAGRDSLSAAAARSLALKQEAALLLAQVWGVRR